ncbi:MAG TPA: aminotransferase class IV [Bacilli bacterium]|nr:aminotransferase class IV [Bacilli bacterium]
MYVYLNGKIVPIQEATVSVLDHGFLYGAGLFETMRTVGGRPMFWQEHMTRLRESADELGISIPWSDDELEKGVVDTVQANGLQEAYIRLTVTRGEGALGPSGKSCTTPTLVIYVKELILPPSHVYEQGRDLIVLQTVRSTPETPVRVKSLNYLNSLLAYRELELRGAAEGIQLTKEGYVAEGAVSNLFFVVDGELWTPSLETGILSGVTRAWVINQVREMGVNIRERRFTLDELVGLEEAFSSSSIVGIIHAKSISAVNFQKKGIGIVSRTLQGKWKKLTNSRGRSI